MGVVALRKNLGEETTCAEAEGRLYNDYFEKFSGLAEYLNKTKADAQEKGIQKHFLVEEDISKGLIQKFLLSKLWLNEWLLMHQFKVRMCIL